MNARVKTITWPRSDRRVPICTHRSVGRLAIIALDMRLFKLYLCTADIHQKLKPLVVMDTYPADVPSNR
eukprot:3464708-Amphidinium_carterae.1